MSDLQAFPQFATVPEPQLEWLAHESEAIDVPVGDFIFQKGDPIDRLIMVLEGTFELYLTDGKNKKAINRIEKHEITGLLPYSRATTATGYGKALVPSRIATLPRAMLPEMIRQNHELTQVLVHEMNNRIREFTQNQVQNEKLMALGKLSAGLAHELNNPASAMARSAALLVKHLRGLPEDFKKVIRIQADDAAIDRVNQMMYDKLNQPSEPLSLMEQNEREDELYDWFADCDLDDTFDLIPLLAEYRFGPEDLQMVKDELREEDFNPFIKWIVQNMTTHKTVSDIKEAAGRIEGLVQSVKTYSYMDRNPDFQQLDIHEGLLATLKVLDHKISKAGHHLEIAFGKDLPKIEGLPGELNQVWTNLVDNAIDALPEDGGRIEIETESSNDFVRVRIRDNGHGIPEDIRQRIFEPFYTTKEMGQGTGLGLDLVQKIIRQHKGQINLSSEPGATTFEICIPIASHS